MRTRRGDVPAEREHMEKIDKRQAEFDEQTDQLTEDAEDVETVRETEDALDLEITAEAADAVEQSLDEAEGTSVEQFSENGDRLDGTQDESQEHESDLKERSDQTDRDLEQVSDASGRIHSDQTDSSLIAAKEALARAREFLDQQGERAREGRENSERIQQELIPRVNQ